MTTSFPRLAGALLLIGACSLAGAAPPAPSAWTVSWSAAPDSAGPALQPQSIRQVIRTSIGGTGLRVRLSNQYGDAPLTIGALHVGLHAGSGALVPGSDQALLFSGQPSVTIAPGASIVSDAASMAVAPLQELAISLFLPEPVARPTIHGAAMQTAYAARGTDLTTAEAFPGAETTRRRYFLADVEVTDSAHHALIAVMGDSISDGIGSTGGGHRRWTDALAERLQTLPVAVAVSNAGIAGNRLLRDGNEIYVGPSMLTRFERDALDKPGVRWVILSAGINDISASELQRAVPAEQASVQEIIAGMKTLIRRAHARQVRILGATLIPYAGTEDFYSAAGDKKRKAVNAWIRGSGAFDGVVDFDRAVRDPVHPDRLRAEFDSGDHLHPNDAGYRAMAAAVDLRPFARARPGARPAM